MKAKSVLSLVIVISIVFIRATFAAPPRYEIIDLGTLSGYSASTARSINGHGQIVGHVGQSWPDFRAVLFDTTGNGNNIDLGTLGGSRGMAFSINDGGQIVGDSENSSGQLLATLFDQAGSGSNTNLGTLGGGWSGAYSNNNKGQVVGTSDNSSANRHAILFDPSDSSNNMDLGTLPGGDWSGAYSISDNGKVVGWAKNSSGDYRAVLFDSTGDGNNIDLGTLGGNSSTAYSINDSGQIVGLAKNTSDHWRATLFHHAGNGNNINLGSLGGSESWAYSINDTGQIVGWAETALSQRCAALFDPSGNGNNIDLNTLIDPGSGWILEEARSINNLGWIVGYGINPGGDRHAYLLIPKALIIYVDDDAAGANDGSSWEDAFNYLQDALAAAWPGDEIRVARGIYKPDQGSGITPGDREATFQLINGVTLKGGYAGFGEPDPNARNIELCETILTGDLGGNDIDVNDSAFLLWEPTRAENSYHVVTAIDTDETAILDGFTITAGNANGPWPDSKGGGMCNFDCSPTLIKCTFNSNSAYGGGAMRNYQSSPSIIDCTFSENKAGAGGGMVNEDSSPTVINCTFSGNSAHGTTAGTAGVGGMYNYKSSPKITNCTFRGNYGGEGGMYNDSSNPMITNCTFSGNYDGGMVNYKSSPILTNCTFSGNSASWYCAGIYNYYNSQPTLTNCILWNDSNEIWNGDDSTITITYSDVQGGWPGEGNIDAAPLFVDPGYWEDPCNTPDKPWDDVWNDGDYNLLAGSPCIDTGDPNYVAEPNETDLDGKPRVIGGRIDMGAYEALIFAEAEIEPDTLNLTSKGKWITAFIQLPEEYSVTDIDFNSIILENEIKPDSFRLTEDNKSAVAKFGRSEAQAILNIGEVELTITGQLNDGIPFKATDIITVIDKTSKKSLKRR
jgi:probable HAF family extracellular repeat protein/parallel beta-helix repeat protein